MEDTAPTYPKFVSVILDIAIDKMLDYGVPAALVPLICKGMLVEVPVRGKLQKGYIIKIKDTSCYSPIKPLAALLSDRELITEELFELAVWMASYYCTSLRRVLKILLPASVRSNTPPKEQLYVMRAKTKEKLSAYCSEIRVQHAAQGAVLDVMLQVKKGILLTELLAKSQTSRSPVDTLVKNGYLLVDIVRIDRSPLINEHYFQTKAKQLHAEQAAALEKITTSLMLKKFETHLLYGITGSGKTEVYLQAIEYALKQGKGTIMLVPEIALTPQTIERFKARFEIKIAILHHRLSQGERLDEWQKIKSGEAQIVIGARSAIFCPVHHLGLIIVDEEHEGSYKQTEEMPCYHARDVAVMRGHLAQATVILGSATPSLESFYNVSQGKYTLSSLSSRANIEARLPHFTVVDMKKEFEKAKGHTYFSDFLLQGIKRRCELGEQSILFLNRRGYHTLLMCQACQKPLKCDHCALSLTFHLGENVVSCHLCGFYLKPPPKQCTFCHSDSTLKFKGAGTELMEKALHAIFPTVRTLRVDADTTKHKGSHQKLLRDFATGKADVLIGTQMIAKGLHFPAVTLVGILNCDQGLNIPDYRASETTFQLITQVAGRAGRGAIAGEVIIQTALPENNTIHLAATHNYLDFYREELASRQLFNYPPCTQMVKLLFSGLDEKQTFKLAEQLRQQLQEKLPTTFFFNPVIPAGHAKVKDKFRFHFFVFGPTIYPINRAIESSRSTLVYPATTRLLIDVNPLSTFF